MKALFVIVLAIFSRGSSQLTKEVFLVRADGFTGWVFVIPDNELSTEVGKYEMDTTGVVYVPRFEPEFRFRLLDSGGADISKNVKLFRTSYYRNQKTGKSIAYYMFYYPTDEQLSLGDEFWSDFELYEKFTYDGSKRSSDLQKRGYFDKSE